MRRLLLFLLAAAFCGGGWLFAADQGPVQLTLSSQSVDATTTFEIGFSEPMVAQKVVGKENQKPPMVFTPALKGSFTWLDSYRGVFVPKEPMALGTNYKISLRKGLEKADGKPFPAQNWSETVSTPQPMVTRAWATESMVPVDMTAHPHIAVLFNMNVTPEAAAPFVKFVNAKGGEAAAHLERPTEDRYGFTLFTQGSSAPDNDVSWRDQFLQAGRAPAERTRTRANLLWASPEKQLPVADGWKLVIAAGLPASDEPLKLAATANIAIGDVKPFNVTKASGENYVNSGKHLVLQFSKPFGKAVTPKNAVWWVTVDPPPADLKYEVEGNEVRLNGSFELKKPYHVAVNPELPCDDGVPFTKKYEHDVTFDRVPPRLYFEEFSTHQLASGSRQFHLMAVNVPNVAVIARLYEGAGAAQILNSWEKYERAADDVEKKNPDEPYERVDGLLIPHTMVFTKGFEAKTEVDAKKEITLDWNEILGPGRTGVVLLEACELPAGSNLKPTKSTFPEVPSPSIRPAQGPHTQAIVQVTDIGAVWKASNHEVFLYAFSLATGKPLPNAKLQVFDDAHKQLATAQTDVIGSARLAANDKAKWILVRHDTDEHLLPFGAVNQINLERYRGAGPELVESDDFTGYDDREQKLMLFTERDIYRPGETLHLKGVARDFTSGASRPPAGEKVHVTVADSRQRNLFERELTVSKTGAFDADVPLTSSSLGSYNISVMSVPKHPDSGKPEDEPLTLGNKFVEVAEYAPNAFEVQVNTPPRIVAPNAAQVRLTANYYMGKPLSKAQIKWTVRGSDDNFAPSGFAHFTFCEGLQDYRIRQLLGLDGDFNSQGQGQLGADGLASLTSEVPVNSKSPQPRSVRMLFEVTDLDQQTVSTEHDYTVDSSDFYLGVRQFPEVLREGAPLPIQVVAVTPEGKPVDKTVETKVRLSRIEWQTNRVQGADDASNYDSTPVLHFLSEQTISTSKLVKEDRHWNVAENTATAEQLTAGKPGQYLLEASAKDANGREAITRMTFYVFGNAQTVWNYRNPFQVDLVPDKDRYQVGEKAVLLVKTPISGDALVTVERENVRRAFLRHLEGNAPAIEIPLEDADAPNVYVSVMLLRGANDSTHKIKKPEYRVGYASLTVDRPTAKLTVYVQPDAPKHQPGEQVSLTAEVLNYLGKPVPNAEVTLYAVDEGVLSLTGYQTPDLFTYFNQTRGLGVRTGLTLPKMLSENPDDRDYANKGFLVGDKGGDDRIRRNFLACAYWGATLKTGPDGHLLAKFVAPDGLTRYRLMAVAQTVENQFGSGESSFEINKPVMLEPAPPRFANLGDKLLLRALLHNTTDFAGEAEVQLDLDDTVTVDNPTRRVALPAQGTLAVDFPAEFKKTGGAVWTWRANFVSTDGKQKYHDAAEVKLKVDYPTPLRRDVRMARIDAAEANLLDRVPPDLLDGAGTMKVRVMNSRVAELGEAVRYLLDYPYGCVEQTTSNMLPWLVLGPLRRGLPGLDKTDAEAEKVVEKGVDRLLTMETESGGLSYWPGGKEPEFWASAYGGMGLVLVQRAGYAAPEEDTERVCKYLSNRLRGLSDTVSQEDLSAACFAVYTLALAGKAEPSYHELLYGKRNRLTYEDRAVLALAILEAKGPASMVADLLDTRKPAPETDYNSYDWFGCAARQQAVQLLAWIRFRPKDPAVDRLAADLISGMHGGHWGTTQGDAWSLLAMSEYVQRIERPIKEASGTVTWAGNAQPFKLDAKVHAAEAAWPLTAAANAAPETLALQLSNPEKRRLFTETVISLRPRLIEQPRQDNGYSLDRTYYKLGDDGRLLPLGKPVVGDRILVQFHLVARKNGGYLAIEDPLPSVFEALNPDIKTQQTGEPNWREADWNWYCDYLEFRDDRAMFFRDHVTAGDYRFGYVARVRAAGEAVAPAARVQEMYHPERFGQTATEHVVTVAAQ